MTTSQRLAFRKISVEQISSPDQIDDVLRVTSIRSWLTLLGVGIIVAAATVWGIFGTVTTKTEGRGVIVRSGGVLNVSSQGGGVVLQVQVKPGDYVQANQVIAKVAQPVLLEQIRAAKRNLVEATEDRDRALRVGQKATSLEVVALSDQRENVQREIDELEQHAKVVKDQVKVEEDLYTKGLITRQQVLAEQDKYIATQDSAASKRAALTELEVKRYEAQAAPEESVGERNLRITNLQLEVAGLQKELELAENVVPSFAGQVIEVKTLAGDVVTNSQPIVSIQPLQETLEVIAYVPSTEAKRIKPGMQAETSPTFVKREEFGFIRGTVVYVSDYPTTPAALMRNFQNQPLVSALQDSGPVTEIRVMMRLNAAKPTSFEWSGARSPDVAISAGTICNLQIVTREQRPISLLLPTIKGAVGT
jgi:HlyD family secretion protein